eukprot:Gb_18453 [translate_table: standard]
MASFTSTTFDAKGEEAQCPVRIDEKLGQFTKQHSASGKSPIPPAIFLTPKSNHSNNRTNKKHKCEYQDKVKEIDKKLCQLQISAILEKVSKEDLAKLVIASIKVSRVNWTRILKEHLRILQALHGLELKASGHTLSQDIFGKVPSEQIGKSLHWLSSMSNEKNSTDPIKVNTQGHSNNNNEKDDGIGQTRKKQSVQTFKEQNLENMGGSSISHRDHYVITKSNPLYGKGGREHGDKNAIANISLQEVHMILKHSRGASNENVEHRSSVEASFGVARLWLWEAIHYQWLKRGPISISNNARRIAQNEKFGIVDKYIGSNSGWWGFRKEDNDIKGRSSQ